MVYGRGGGVPQESAECSKYLYPLSSSQLLTYVQQEVLTAIESEQGFHSYDLKLSELEVASGVINDSRKTHTIMFRCSENGHNYGTLNCKSFSKFNCNWIGAVQDCYYLSAGTSSNAFQLFFRKCTFPLFLRAMKNLGYCPQLIISTQLKISRQRKTLIWLIRTASLATVNVNISKKSTILFRVLWNRWAGVNEFFFFFKTV